MSGKEEPRGDSKPQMAEDTTETVRQQLKALVSHLQQERETILNAWRDATEQSSETTTAATLTRIQFNDHVPLVLDALAQHLCQWPAEETSKAQKASEEKLEEHGVQRWQQGYSLPELIREWGQLQTVLTEVLEDYALAHPELDSLVMPIARRALLTLSTGSIANSVDQYWILHQTEAASYAQSLEQAIAELNQLKQLRAKNWHEAAHDLRGGLSVVQGASSELTDEGLDHSLRREFSGLLHRGVESVQIILADLMSLARLDAGLDTREIAPFDAAELVREFCKASQPLAQKRGLFLKLEGPDQLPIEGDRGKVLRILQNLLLNSLKYTRKGGVTVILDKGKDPEVKEWVLCVQDTGPGMTGASKTPLAEQLSEASQSSHASEASNPAGGENKAPTVPAQSETLSGNQQPGEGIGLSIVKRLCELLEASLELETSPGKGSTFRVILPCSYGPQASRSESETETDSE